MKRPEDLAWERLVERIELDASDADLAAAEEALRGADSEEVSPELIEDVLARARAEADEVEAAPAIELVQQPRPIRALPRFRRLAAAAAAFLFGTKLSAATTVTAFAVLTTVTVLVINSREMSYADLVTILQRDDSSVVQVKAALQGVGSRVVTAIQSLYVLRDDPNTSVAVQDEIRAGTDALMSRRQLPPPEAWIEVGRSAARALEQGISESDRLFYVRNTLSLAGVGIEAMRSFRQRSPELEADARTYRQWIRDALSR